MYLKNLYIIVKRQYQPKSFFFQKQKMIIPNNNNKNIKDYTWWAAKVIKIKSNERQTQREK